MKPNGARKRRKGSAKDYLVRSAKIKTDHYLEHVKVEHVEVKKMMAKVRSSNRIFSAR